MAENPTGAQKQLEAVRSGYASEAPCLDLGAALDESGACLLYTSDAADDAPRV